MVSSPGKDSVDGRHDLRMSASVRDQTLHSVRAETPAPFEVGELDHEPEPDDDPTEGLDQPAGGRGGEIGLELVEAPQFLFDRFGQFAARLAAFAAGWLIDGVNAGTWGEAVFGHGDDGHGHHRGAVVAYGLSALAGLALLSTALAYVLYFRILAAAGATNLLLVTFLIWVFNPAWIF